MRRGIIMMDDSVVVFEPALPSEVQDGSDWAVTFGDAVTGKEERRLVAKDQLAAVVALMLGLGVDDDPESELSQGLYTLAEPAVEGLGQDLRPIP